jgi:hypothetical protein
MQSVTHSETGRKGRGFWSRLFGSGTLTTDSSEEALTADRELPDQYQDCRSYAEKVAWINSPRGQDILKKRPVLLEYYKSGKLDRMMQNKHWSQRLNEWLFINPAEQAVPLGLGVDIPKELKPNERESFTIHKDNPPIHVMFRNHPAFLAKMSFPTEAKYHILTEGFTTFSGVIPQDVVDRANAVISRMIVESNEFRVSTAERQKNPKIGVDPFFTTGGTNDPDVLALYYCSPIACLVESLLHNQLIGPESVDRNTFSPRTHAAQVAFRLSQAEAAGASLWRASGRRKLGGRSWHLDGMDKGLYGPFSLLVGVALSDQLVDDCGNLAVHPGSHHTLKPFLKQYSAACDHSDIDTSDAQAVQDRRMYAVSLVQNKPNLGEPVQVKLAKGDVVFALHKVAHLGTPNHSAQIRKMVYFRVSHRNLQKLRGPALDDIWLEYEGMGEVL